MKNEIRKNINERIRSLDSFHKKEKSLLAIKNLSHLLKDLFATKNEISLGLYAPLSDELDCREIEFEMNISPCFPATDPNGNMLFKSSPYGDLIESKDFGVTILSPRAEAKVVTPEALLIPARAFDLKGGRLGRGKGYYDKYLEKFSYFKIGIGFDEQILDEVPMSDHDVYMDFVVTDKRIIKVKK